MLPRELVKKIKQIEIRTNRLVNETLGGEYQSIFKGQGMEFNEVREYQYGDDIRSIDWNVTSRTAKLHVKKYVEERELTVVILVDVSGSVKFGTTGRFKSEIAAELAALFAFSAIKNNDRVGLLLFTDKIEKYLPPAKGVTHVLRVIRELLHLEPQKTGTDLTGALEYLNRVQRKKAVVFLLSDFSGAGYEKAMRITNRRHDLVVFNIVDPKEYDVPPVGLIRLRDNETGEEITVNSRARGVRDLIGKRWKERNSQLADFFARSGIDCLNVDIGRSYLKDIVRFFKKRAKKKR